MWGNQNLLTNTGLCSCFSFLPFHHKTHYAVQQERGNESNKSAICTTYLRNKLYGFDLHFAIYSKSIYFFKANSVVVEQQVFFVYSHLKRQEAKQKTVLNIHYTSHVSNCKHTSLVCNGLLQKQFGTKHSQECPRNIRLTMFGSSMIPSLFPSL